MTSSSTHFVLIPSYNPGPKVYDTVRAARAHWAPVWVVVDGSEDGTAEGLTALAAGDDGLRVTVLPHNVGKGAAVLHGLDQAAAEGFTHALTMDSDGQHPAELIPRFMAESAAQPEAMVLGKPVFDASAPLLRVRGRNREAVPYLLDEGGSILTAEDGQPLISNAQVSRLIVNPPTLKAKERR